MRRGTYKEHLFERTRFRRKVNYTGLNDLEKKQNGEARGAEGTGPNDRERTRKATRSGPNDRGKTSGEAGGRWWCATNMTLIIWSQHAREKIAVAKNNLKQNRRRCTRSNGVIYLQ